MYPSNNICKAAFFQEYGKSPLPEELPAVISSAGPVRPTTSTRI